MPKVKEFTVTIEDKPGALGKCFLALAERGELADLAPTALALLGLEPPDEMTGKSLVRAT